MLEIHRYNPLARVIFDNEAQKIKNIIDNDCKIEHIGSTAIPDMDGKNVIDIMLVFNTKTDIKKAAQKLSKYYFQSNAKAKDERIFMSSTKTDSRPGDIHIHLVAEDSQDYRAAILFRDYLTVHPKAKKEYRNLKYRLKQELGDDRAKYTELKGDFIKNIIKKAARKKLH